MTESHSVNPKFGQYGSYIPKVQYKAHFSYELNFSNSFLNVLLHRGRKRGRGQSKSFDKSNVGSGRVPVWSRTPVEVISRSEDSPEMSARLEKFPAGLDNMSDDSDTYL